MSFIKMEFMGQIKKMWFLSFSLFEVIISSFAATGMNVNIHDLIGRSNLRCVLLFFFLVFFLETIRLCFISLHLYHLYSSLLSKLL